MIKIFLVLVVLSSCANACDKMSEKEESSALASLNQNINSDEVLQRVEEKLRDHVGHDGRLLNQSRSVARAFRQYLLSSSSNEVATYEAYKVYLASMKSLFAIAETDKAAEIIGKITKWTIDGNPTLNKLLMKLEERVVVFEDSLGSY